MTSSKLMTAFIGLSTVFLLFPFFPAVSQKSKASASEIDIQASDTIFRQASNSPGYLVVKEADWDRLRKVWTDSLKQNEKLLIQEQKNSQAKVDSIQGMVDSMIIEESGSKSYTIPTNTSDLTIPALIFGLGLLFIYGLVITIKLLSQKIGIKSQIDRLDQLEKDLEQHKRNSIERERKLMRELIDTQNELEEERSQQNQDSE